MFDDIKRLTAKQMKALTLIAPGPLGEGLTYEEAAKVLEISKYSLISRLNHFKTRFPDAWNNFESMRSISQKQRKSLKNPISLSYGVNENRIVERF